MTSSDQEDVFIVERIENKKVRNGIAYYLIKWEGYEEKTWEPEANIIDSQLIDEFNAKFDAKKPISPTDLPKSSQTITRSVEKGIPKKISKIVTDENDHLNNSSMATTIGSTMKEESFKEIQSNNLQNKSPEVTVKSGKKEISDLTLDSGESTREDSDFSEEEFEIEQGGKGENSYNWKCEVCQKMKPKPTCCSYCTTCVHPSCARDASTSYSTKNGIFCIACFKKEPICDVCKGGPKSKGQFYRCSRCNICIHLKCEKKDEKFNLDEFYCSYCTKFNAPIQFIITRRTRTQESSRSEGMVISDEEEAEEVGITESEYYVKFDGKSYRSCQWVPEVWLKRVAAIKLNNFLKLSCVPSMEDLILPDFLKIDRILAYKSFPVANVSGKSDGSMKYEMKAFVKWCGLSYSDCTWERESDLLEYDSDEFNSKLTAYKKSLIIFKAWNPVIPTTSSFQEFKETPSFLNKKVLPHQLEGINWISYKWILKQNVMLADEMGLGKTIQTIGFLMNLFKTFKTFPFLIVCPTSVCLNWQEEFEQWAPELSTVVYSGTQKEREVIAEYELFNQFIPKGSSKFTRPIKNHVIIVSYSILSRDRQIFSKIPWEVVVVDEAHRLKGTTNELSGILDSIAAKFKLILTGTPLQNNLRELFNIMRYIAPEKFKNASSLEEYYSDMSANPSKVTELHESLRPYMLRRTKADVSEFYSIPPKAEIVLPVTMTPFQSSIYKLLFEKNKNVLLSKLGANAKRVNFENLMVELRKCANHPLLCTTRNIKEIESEKEWNIDDIINASGKLVLLVKLAEKLLQKEHKILIFSGMVKMLDIIEQILSFKQHSSLRIDGSTSPSDRQNLVNMFNAKGNTKYNTFLLSTRAGGLGINLQAADSIIMYDADWNPHQDLQAFSRAHRFGQSKPVVIYKLLTLNSVEEKIAQIANKKLFLDHVVVERMKDKQPQEKGNEEVNLFEVLACGASKLFEDENRTSFVFDDEMTEELTDFDTIISKYQTHDSADSEKGLSNNGIFKEGFKFAKIWESASTSLPNESYQSDSIASSPEHISIETEDYFWNKIFKPDPEAEQQQQQKQEEELGIGKRKRKTIVDDLDSSITELLEPSETGEDKKSGKRKKKEDEVYEDLAESEEFEEMEKDGGGEEENVQKKKAASLAATKVKTDFQRYSYPSFQYAVPQIDTNVHKFDLAALVSQSNYVKNSKQLILHSLQLHPISSLPQANQAADTSSQAGSVRGFCWFVLSNAIFFNTKGYVCLKLNLDTCVWSIMFINSLDILALKMITGAEQIYCHSLRSRLIEVTTTTLNRGEEATTLLQDKLHQNTPLGGQQADDIGVIQNAVPTNGTTNGTTNGDKQSFHKKPTIPSFSSQQKPTTSFKLVELITEEGIDFSDTPHVRVSSVSPLNTVKSQIKFNIQEFDHSSDIETNKQSPPVKDKKQEKEKDVTMKKEPVKQGQSSVAQPQAMIEIEMTKAPLKPVQKVESNQQPVVKRNSPPPLEPQEKGVKKKKQAQETPTTLNPIPSSSVTSLDTLNLFSIEQLVTHLEGRLTSLKSTLTSLPLTSLSSKESLQLENEVLKQHSKSLANLLARSERRDAISQQINHPSNQQQFTAKRSCDWHSCGRTFNTREALLAHLEEHF